MPHSRTDQPNSEIEQLSKPYMSTVELSHYLSSLMSKYQTSLVLDLGCGIGAQSIYFAKIFPEVQFIGLDYNQNHIEFAKNIILKEQVSNLSFEVFDVLSSTKNSIKNDIEVRDAGLISVHTLCCFKNFEPFFDAIIALNPNWFIINSLFFSGKLEILVHIRDLNNSRPDEDPDSDFNMFSKELVASYLENFGYTVEYRDFFPERDLPKPKDGRRGTYTLSTDFHPRTQFSGPVHLPWSFLIAVKS